MMVCVVIPTYNEADTIDSLVSGIKQLGFDVLVVDDGSVDNTKQIARDRGAVVLENKANLGKGLSLRRGFDYAVSRDYDFVVTMDGDGQHSPLDIASFVALAAKENADIIVGDRMQNCIGMPWIRMITNRFMSFFISKVAGQRIPDTQCGFRLIKSRVLRTIKLVSDRFEIESEILIRAAKSGFKIVSMPIKTIYRGEKSKINPLIDSFRFVRLILSIKHEKH